MCVCVCGCIAHACVCVCVCMCEFNVRKYVEDYQKFEIKINMIKNLKICNEIVMSYIGRKLRALLNFHLQYSLGGAVSNHARTHS